jgi:2-hydroxychromene-2-carboxylate isomerase
MVRSADWYFDFISPFAYLQFQQLAKLPPGLVIHYKPLLFAGLLDHWGQKGPAEIAAKRKFTYRFVQWKAGELGIPLKFPVRHPFNPIPFLRAAIALGTTHDAIARIFDFLWKDGNDPSASDALNKLGKRLAADDLSVRVIDPTVKEKLKQNGQDAVELGVFGVPTFVANGELFWGSDSFEMFRAYLQKPDLFQSTEMLRVSDLPVGQERKVLRE